ncbi:uncharacterized protein TRAVEDRAFT_119859 [Trametes versicolor FP-101664 SS1]|uniref:uncharacterized protein n=1 Tax=Trametes versicolor (strain FP-101664) TaxID=717944 RepID=UPI0004621E7E|nr:uncharacterized protein TRAVEDRAFT_119859 [Trametes versicolor FP-101664 SS1]EIW60874.1 hypothetical protein TRAVEDRAFT_119859 [Trametes versicolor FP-101664 SS1]
MHCSLGLGRTVEAQWRCSGGAVEERGKLRELLWEDEPVPIRNPELVDVLLKVQEAEEKLTQARKAEEKGADASEKSRGVRSKRGGVASYDAILLALSEAKDVSRKLVEVHKVRAHSMI